MELLRAQSVWFRTLDSSLPGPPPLTPAGAPRGDPNRSHSAATTGALRWAEKRGCGGVDSKKL